MFYRPEEGHGLPQNPLNAIVAPRPIGWISTRGTLGDNLAPYSFFNAVAYEPPQVMFATTSGKPDQPSGTKDSLSNIAETGVFCVNVVAFEMREAMNASSAALPKEVDEFEHAGLTPVDCETINCARIDGVPAALECRLTQIVTLPGESNRIAFGEVIGIHLRDDCLVEGVFDVTRFQPLARMGYRDYSVVQEVFSLARPDD